MFKFGKKKGDPAADANLPAVKEGEAAVEGDDAAAPKKKKLPLLFIIAPVALLVLGGGGAAAFFMLKPKPAEAHGAEAEAGHGEEKADKKAEGKEEKKEGGGHGGGKGARPILRLGPFLKGRMASPSTPCPIWS